MLQSGLVFICILCALTFWAVKPRKRPKNYPPGPTSYGIVGNLFNVLLRDPLGFPRDFLEYKTKYEKVMSYDPLHKSAVLINDLEVMKEALNSNSLAYRAPLRALQIDDRHTTGFLFSDQPECREMQRFSLSALKTLGLGKTTMEPLMIEEAEKILEVLRQNENRPVCTTPIFRKASFTIVGKLLMGPTFRNDDPRILSFLNTISRCQQNDFKITFMFLLPRLWKYTPFYGRQDKQGIRDGKLYFQEVMQRRRVDFEPGEQNDFLGTYLSKIRETKDPNSPFFGEKAYAHAEENLATIINAGMETNKTAFRWIFLYLALHPEKQQKAFEELDKILVGRCPFLEDRALLPYCQAVIRESLRKSSQVVRNLPHVALEDMTIGGYDVPKGTMVVCNIYGIMHCPKTWTEPGKFMPERFLSGDGTTLIDHPAFIPFSVGKRACPGRQMSEQLQFIIMTRILREFEVRLNPGEPRPPMETKLMVGLMPLDHTLIFKPRNISSCETQVNIESPLCSS